MTSRDYATDEAELLHDIRELLAILVFAQFNRPEATAIIADDKVRCLVNDSIKLASVFPKLPEI